MIRLRRSEALWIVRGIRLGKFLRRCGRSVRRLFRPAVSEAEAETVETVAPRPAAPGAIAAEAMPGERELSRRRFESSPACADRRVGVEPHIASRITRSSSSRRVQ